MNEYLKQLEDWLNADQQVTLARVTKTWGSSPRPTGSVMLINDRGELLGSVSGGCIEGAVAKKAADVRVSQQSRVLNFGVSDEDAWSVGLSCGGSLQVFLEHMDPRTSPVWNELLDHLKNNRSAILISSLEEEGTTTTLLTDTREAIGDPVSDQLRELALQAYDERTHRLIALNGKEYFVQLFPRKAQLFIIGAAHITVDLVSLAKQFGFETIVIDPRGYFATQTVFPDAPDHLIEKYPSEVLGDFNLDAYSFAAILSHDPKIDDNALELLLASKVAYIGALGSRKTHAKRVARLLEEGVSQEQIDRIHAPIGVHINARTAREIALAIMAQIIEAKNAHLIR